MKNLKFLFLLFFLLPFCNVNAAELDYYSNDIHKSTSVTGWDLYSDTYTYIEPINPSPGVYEIPCNVGPTAYGCGITFDTGVEFKSGYYYSVKVYLGVGENLEARANTYFNPAVGTFNYGTIWNSYYGQHKLNLFTQYADEKTYFFYTNDTVDVYFGNTITYIFKLNNDETNGDIFFAPILAEANADIIYFFGSITESLGSDLSASELERILGQSNQVIINQNEQIINQNQATNDKLDDMINADADPSVTPDDDKYNDYESAEGDLKDKVNQADLSNLSIGIDSSSSNWVWETLTNLINSHSVIFGMFIAILSIGVIKLALGR